MHIHLNLSQGQHPCVAAHMSQSHIWCSIKQLQMWGSTAHPGLNPQGVPGLDGTGGLCVPF
jgi:hypothetical protein